MRSGVTTEEAAAMERQMLDPEEYDNAFVPKHRARIPRSREAHTKTELSTLLDSRYRDILSPKTPLYLFLQIKTRDGRKPVRLTNATAADHRRCFFAPFIIGRSTVMGLEGDDDDVVDVFDQQ